MIHRLRICSFFIFGWLIALLLSSSISAQPLAPEAENQRGFELLNRGAASEAILAWETAQQLYEQAGNQEGVLGTQFNQAMAQQAMGLYPLSCQTITQALDIRDSLCLAPYRYAETTEDIDLSEVSDTPMNMIGLRLLGDALAKMGQIAEAKAVLTVAQESSPQSVTERGRIALSAGNVYTLQVKQAIQDYERLGYRNSIAQADKLSQVKRETSLALAQYAATSRSMDAELSTKADLNSIELLSSLLSADIADSSKETASVEVAAVAKQSYSRLGATNFSFDRLPAIENIYAKLGLARNLLAIRSSSSADSFWHSVSDEEVHSLIKSAIDQAVEIGDSRGLSFSYGTYGDFLKAIGNVSHLSALYDRALLLSQAVQAPDASYQWAYKLALLNEEAGDAAQARKYYKTAISALSVVRDDLLAINSEVRFGFREKVEPVYRDYIRFLLSLHNEAEVGEAVRIHDSLQLAQIENYLRCGRLTSSTEPGKRTTVHIINLDSTVEIIVSSQDRLLAYSTPASDVLLAAKNLGTNVQSENFFTLPEEEFLPYAQLLYDKLLRSAVEAGWLPEDVELSFVLDTPFQSIPMALLHDGQQYLIERNPLSASLQMSQLQKKIESSGALFAGISEIAPSFAAVDDSAGLSELPTTEFEQQYINDYARTKVLMNGSFTAKQLKNEIDQKNLNVVHLSTHGQFSSIPEQTFLLAWDKLIGFSELGQIFQSAEGINLLFLSACETATGDERASLGLAGLAIQSSARNAIATLWAADSESTSVLVSLFYESLTQEGTSIAEALQQSQKLLLSSDAFNHPYYWAPFILAAS